MATTLPTGRLEAFSDGVFAIAITLLVLPLVAVIGYLAIALVLLAPVGLGRSGPSAQTPGG